MFDSYIIFFELGLKTLNNAGILGYITSNSYLKNKAATQLRNYLLAEKKIKIIIDFNFNQVFPNITSYTAITILDKNINNNVFFKYLCLEKTNKQTIKKIYYCNLYKNEKWIFKLNDKYKNKMSDIADIKYGIATLSDKIYITNKFSILNNSYVKFNEYKIEKQITKKIIKGTKISRLTA